MSKQILVLPGDGIGPEIMAEAVMVLQLPNDKFQLDFELSYDELGGAAVDKYGVPLADETLARAQIARPSCRERVFHYVLIPVVDVSFKQKYTITNLHNNQ